MEFKFSPATVRRGRRLAERQRAHLFELELTGRWRLYFKSEEDFHAKLEAAARSVAQWEALAAQTPSEMTPAEPD